MGVQDAHLKTKHAILHRSFPLQMLVFKTVPDAALPKMLALPSAQGLQGSRASEPRSSFSTGHPGGTNCMTVQALLEGFDNRSGAAESDRHPQGHGHSYLGSTVLRCLVCSVLRREA